jgi:enamine deaminase RidA (YjgF/YER057c/UK114 family)
MPKIENYVAPTVFDPPSYAQGVAVTGAEKILFLSGQVAYDENGGVMHPGDVKAQAREAFRTLQALVEAQGGSLANIVKLNTYLTDINDRAAVAEVRADFFPGKAPASTLVGVSSLALPGWVIEIEATAVL